MKKKEYIGLPHTFCLKIDEVEWKRGYDDGEADFLNGLSPKDCSHEKFKAYQRGYMTRYQQLETQSKR